MPLSASECLRLPLSASECLAQVEDLAELECNRAELARRLEAARRAAAEREAAAGAAAVAAAHDDAFEEELLEKRNLTMIAPARLIAWRARSRKRHTERISKELDSKKAMGGEVGQGGVWGGMGGKVGHLPVAAPVAGAAPSELKTAPPELKTAPPELKTAPPELKTAPQEPVTPATSQSVKFGAATTSSPIKSRQISSSPVKSTTSATTKSAKSILQRASAAARGTGAPLHVDSVPPPPPPPPGPPTIAFVRREEDDADHLDYLEGLSRQQKVGESTGAMAEMMLARARTRQPKEQGGAAVEQAVPTTHGEGWAIGKALWSTAKGTMRAETNLDETQVQ